MDNVVSNGIVQTGTIVPDRPQTWELPSVHSVFDAVEADLTAGLPEFVQELPYFNKDLENKVFAFRSMFEYGTDEAREVKGVRFPDQQYALCTISLFNPNTDTWDEPHSAKFQGAWVIPQLHSLSYLQMTTRAWTIRKNPAKGNAWMLARPDREQLGRKSYRKSVADAGEYVDFVKSFEKLGYSEEEVKNLVGRDKLVGIDYAATLQLLAKQKRIPQARAEIDDSGATNPTVRAAKVHA